MNASSRRQVIGLGLTAGLSAVISAAARADSATETGAVTGSTGELRFRLPADYQPDISPAARQALSAATLEFLLATHPPGMTLSIWEQAPREMPFLERHLDATVDAVCDGVAANLDVYPVDPVLVMSLLYNESRFSPTALSPSGALGIAQFMPDTALEYDLAPQAHQDLWQAYRAVRADERKRRAAQRAAFVKKFGLAEFSANAVIDRAVETGSLEVLGAWQAVNQADQPEREALNDYLGAVRETVDAHDYFADDGKQLAGIDARTGYAAASAAVTYIAARLTENSGMASSAVAAYNAGPAAVTISNSQSVLYRFGDVPANPETVRYVQRIMVVYTRLNDLLV